MDTKSDDELIREAAKIVATVGAKTIVDQKSCEVFFDAFLTIVTEEIQPLLEEKGVV